MVVARLIAYEGEARAEAGVNALLFHAKEAKAIGLACFAGNAIR